MSTENPTQPGLIYKRIPEIMRAVGAVGKNKQNTHQKYSFRGIDDMYNALHEHLCAAGVFATPQVLSREREERKTGNGGNLIYTILEVRHTFYAEDGSSVAVCTVGEAMDSGDKSSNKAMSAAFKYALMELFCIPTEEKLDTEYDSPQPAPRSTGSRNGPQRQQQRPPQQSQARSQAPLQSTPQVDADGEVLCHCGQKAFFKPTKSGGGWLCHYEPAQCRFVLKSTPAADAPATDTPRARAAAPDSPTRAIGERKAEPKNAARAPSEADRTAPTPTARLMELCLQNGWCIDETGGVSLGLIKTALQSAGKSGVIREENYQACVDALANAHAEAVAA